LPPARFVSFRGDEAAEVASGARGSWIGGAGASASGRGAASVGAGASSSASRTSSPAVAEPVPVPDVTGLPMRVAVRRIHSLGLRVEWSDVGSARGIRPAPGSRLMPGDTVVIVGGLP
ncbi:MAG: PASTA domain-containing protein, partial [Longimicrobiales bacterium]|nr:PASTA domain-containing protein [Longimicrobiales bacterium]